MKHPLSIRRVQTRFIARCMLVVLAFMSTFTNGLGQTIAPPYPVKRAEDRERWQSEGRLAVERAKALRAQRGHAKNVILFIGDGMGITTITAARILEGQKVKGSSGEENSLSFEEFPYLALSKTYSVNQQTPDSAPTMTAIVTGVKTDDGVLSVDQRAVRGNHTTVKGNELKTILEFAEERGLSTGVVSTARVTHATPGACYAHSPERDWESDKNLSEPAKAAGFRDIARQLIDFPYGDGLEVVLGGGRSKFLPKEVNDPEYNSPGERLDGLNLTEKWVNNAKWAAKAQASRYVWNKQDFDNVDVRKTSHLLGLFEPSHMKYEHDRALDKGKAGEPSLTEMTQKAIDILSKNRKGYFLMVEGGRIDHAHHSSNAYRALTDTIELSNAVRAALAKVDLRETLVIVTADHSHVFTMAGYPTRGNNILGLVRKNDEATGELAKEYAKDSVGRPFTTLGYANGPGYTGKTSDEKVGQNEGPKRYPHDGKKYSYAQEGRPDLTNVNTADPDYMQESTLPLHYDPDPRKGFGGETHGGEDVAIFAGGPGAYLFHGVQEQNYIFHVMYEALSFSRRR